MNTIYGLRMASGMTQAELAQKAGLSRPTVSAAENHAQGDFYLEYKTVLKLAVALGVTMDDLGYLCLPAGVLDEN